MSKRLRGPDIVHQVQRLVGSTSGTAGDRKTGCAPRGPSSKQFSPKGQRPDLACGQARCHIFGAAGVHSAPLLELQKAVLRQMPQFAQRPVILPLFPPVAFGCSLLFNPRAIAFYRCVYGAPIPRHPVLANDELGVKAYIFIHASVKRDCPVFNPLLCGRRSDARIAIKGSRQCDALR